MDRLDHETPTNAVLRNAWQWMTVERQVILRSKGRVRYISVSRARQIGLGGAALFFAAWVGYSSVSFFQLIEAIDTKDEAIAASDRAYRGLVNDVDESRNRFLEIAGLLETNHAHLANIFRRNNVLESDLATLRKKLDHAEAKRRDENRRQEAMHLKISELEEKVRQSENRNVAMADDLRATEDRLSGARRENTEATQAGAELHKRVAQLQTRLKDVRESQSALVDRITLATVGDIRRLNRVVAQTGLNLGRLLAQAGMPKTAQGGPFIPLAKNEEPATLGDALATLYRHIDRWDSLQRVVRRLPLGEPVANYYVASGFGKRRDPVNNRWSVHKGVDLAGPMRQYIYSVAPGKVTVARWNGRFGRMVELDHGSGIRTRYGHMRKISVKRGQRVRNRQVIGLLGSSGRSTGPHLHYEIIVNGKHVSPIKFLKAGKDVFEGEEEAEAKR